MFNYLYNLVYANWHQTIFRYSVYLSYILFALTFTSIFKNAPEYLYSLDNIIKYYVCFILLIRFNPLVNREKNNKNKNDKEFDRHIAFSAGVFLLLTTTISTIAQQFISKNVDYIYNDIDSGIKKII
jgi:hypothetical protein